MMFTVHCTVGFKNQKVKKGPVVGEPFNLLSKPLCSEHQTLKTQHLMDKADVLKKDWLMDLRSSKTNIKDDMLLRSFSLSKCKVQKLTWSAHHSNPHVQPVFQCAGFIWDLHHTYNSLCKRKQQKCTESTSIIFICPVNYIKLESFVNYEFPGHDQTCC